MARLRHQFALKIKIPSVYIKILSVIAVLLLTTPNLQINAARSRPRQLYPLLYDYLLLFKSCRASIHFYLPFGTSEDFYMSTSAFIVNSIPMMIQTVFSENLSESVWDARAQCVLRLLVTEHDTAVGDTMLLQNRTRENNKADREYYVGVGMATESHTKFFVIQSTWRNFRDRIRQIQEVLIHSKNWLILTVREDMDAELLRVHNVFSLYSYCSDEEIFCLKPINPYGRTPKDIWGTLFPRSSSIAQRYPDYYQKLPILLWPVNGLQPRIFRIDYELASSLNLRSLKALKPAQFGYPLVTLCAVVASRLNTTVAIQRSTSFLGTLHSIILPSVVIKSISHNLKLLPVDMAYLDFIYCKNVTWEFHGNALAFFYPFEPAVWLCLVIAIIIIGLLLSVKKRKLFVPSLVLLPLVLQGVSQKMEKLKLLFALWLVVASLLSIWYTCLIESLLIIPFKDPGVDDLRALHDQGYRMVLPDSPVGMTATVREKPVSRFGGNNYTDGLRKNAEYIKAPRMLSTKYLEYLTNHEKKAMVSEMKDVRAVKEAVNAVLQSSGRKEIVCRQGEKRPSFSLFFKSWSTHNPNADVLNKILNRFWSSGMLGYFEKIHEKKRAEYAYGRGLSALKLDGVSDLSNTTNMAQGNNGGFSMENSQTILLFFTWLSACLVLMLVHVGELVKSWWDRRSQRSERVGSQTEASRI